MPLPAVIRLKDTLPLDRIAPGVSGLQTVMVNLFTLQGANSWVLVDTGMPMSANRILRWVSKLHGEGARPSCILLTHGHFDHVGAVENLAKRWNVPVYAHWMELPYLTGRSPYPPPDPTVGGGAFSLLSPLYSRGPIDLGDRVRALPPDGAVPGLAEWKWIHTPGHTAGHVSFYRASDRVLIAGDAIVTTKQESAMCVLTQHLALHGPPAYFTSDWTAAEQSVRTLARLEPQIIATGHGLPMSGKHVPEALHQLAARFEQRVKPHQGRYVERPAVTDDRGIVSLPAPVPYPKEPIILAGLAAMGTFYYLNRRRRSVV